MSLPSIVYHIFVLWLGPARSYLLVLMVSKKPVRMLTVWSLQPRYRHAFFPAQPLAIPVLLLCFVLSVLPIHDNYCQSMCECVLSVCLSVCLWACGAACTTRQCRWQSGGIRYRCCRGLQRPQCQDVCKGKIVKFAEPSSEMSSIYQVNT